MADDTSIRVVVLGAGQDVGRSCILVTLRGKRILFDCGMHLGYNDERRFPDFRYISCAGRFTEALDCVVISHFHLDHCGALPYLSEVCGYDGPVYMTHPTRAIAPLLLQDFRRIMVDRKGVTDFYSEEDITQCMGKVIAVNLLETVHVDRELTLCAHYAGHVLGAAMFCAAVGEARVLYTGDFNMTADRHLGAARPPASLRPQLVISESTYGTSLRDPKPARERQLLDVILSTVRAGGRVLIPVFAVGRAQELMVLLDAHWQRMQLDVPIYFSSGMMEAASLYYKLYARWGSEAVRRAVLGDDPSEPGIGISNPFALERLRPFDRARAADCGPCVLFASPGMLDSGTALDVFRQWAGDTRNHVILPSHCVVGTVGHQLLSGKRDIQVDGGRETINVKCAVSQASFSAHADAKGIFTMLRQVQPENVLLVHGDKCAMRSLRARISSELGINCFCPQNGMEVTVAVPRELVVDVDTSLLGGDAVLGGLGDASSSVLGGDARWHAPASKRKQACDMDITGIMVARRKSGSAQPATLQVLPPKVAAAQLGLQEHTLRFRHVLPVHGAASSAADGPGWLSSERWEELKRHLVRSLEPRTRAEHTSGPSSLCVRSARVERDAPGRTLFVVWDLVDEAVGKQLRAACEDWVCLHRAASTI